MPRRQLRNSARAQRGDAESSRAPREEVRSQAASAAFALTLLAVASVASVANAAAADVPRGPFTGLRARGRSRVSPVVSTEPPVTLGHSQSIAGIRTLLKLRPARDDNGGVAHQCLPSPGTSAIGISPPAVDSDAALRMGLSAYREDLQRVVVAMIRDAVAAADPDTREAFADAEALSPRYMTLRVTHKGTKGWPPPSIYFASSGIALNLRDEQGRWRPFALTLAAQASALVVPLSTCRMQSPSDADCIKRMLGPLFWGDRWASIAENIDDTDTVRFVSMRAGATVSPGWPSPDTPVLESPDMEEVAEILLETVIRGEPSNERLGSRPRRSAIADAGGARSLVTRLSASGLECLAAVIGAGTLDDDAVALLRHLWPASPAQVSDVVALPQPHALAAFPHESFSGPLGRGVQWVLPANVYVEYRPDLTQNGVKVFNIDGTLYGTTVARTRKHASDLRPLDQMRNELGPLALCRISRGVGIDVDGMCLECHTERDGEVSVTEQGATVTQHQVPEASPLARLRVAVYSQPFVAEDGRRQFFAFGRLGEFDAQGIPQVTSSSPLVAGDVYARELEGELGYFEQATTAGPVGGRRIRLTLGNMHVAAPFGTYRDRHEVLHGVVQLSREVYYRFTLPGGGDAPGRVHLQYRHVGHRDIREYWIAQHHRAAAESASVLPTISYGETRTLLQLYLRMWNQAPSPSEVWQGLEDVPLSVAEARAAVGQLTHAIEWHVASARGAGGDETGGLGARTSPDVDPELLPTFNRLWSHWQCYPGQADAFIGAVARDFVSRPSPLAVWSQLPFTGDVQTTRDVLALFEEVFPGMPDLQSLVSGEARAARDVDNRMRLVSQNANIALAEVTLVDGTRTIYYCLSGLQRRVLPTNAPTVRFVDAGRAYLERENNVITQQGDGPRSRAQAYPTEPPALRFVVADANLPTYHAASGAAKSRTLDTERLILAQIYADHPAGENVVRSIVMCSRMPFCDSCAVNLAMVPYHYPNAALRFYYVASGPLTRIPPEDAPALTEAPVTALPQDRAVAHAPDKHVHSTL
ncbi:deaminase domain-containing protein [Pandoraea anapnoica]|uniref:deaminase domain-containing protein n=1 Tax=Pandoraea anapnoica TaxID=2508301 RepID=UPI0015823732|nr:deaminase domain-containing protein [Pandoraea anapnoica]